MTFLINAEGYDDAFYKKVYNCEKVILPSGHNQSTKNHSLLSRVLLGYILKKHYGVEKFSFIYGSNGKPYLKNEALYFNISHSGGYIICSVAEKEIGCDVQTTGKYNPRIAERFFTENERAFLEKSENQPSDFTRLWALKESVLKKTGEGITGGLDSFCFADCLNKNSFIKFGYHFCVSELIGAYISVCSDEKENEITEVNKEEIENYMDTILKGEL